jgi:hypothetical protein
MAHDQTILEKRVLDLFPVTDLGKITVLEWQHEGRELRDETIPFFTNEDIISIKGGFDPGTIWNSIVLHETCGDRVVELYDPEGRMIFDGQDRLQRELDEFDELVDG